MRDGENGFQRGAGLLRQGRDGANDFKHVGLAAEIKQLEKARRIPAFGQHRPNDPGGPQMSRLAAVFAALVPPSHPVSLTCWARPWRHPWIPAVGGRPPWGTYNHPSMRLWFGLMAAPGQPCGTA